MFMVEDRSLAGVCYVVFTETDPQAEGAGQAVSGVSLDYDRSVHKCIDGQPDPEVCLGRAAADPKKFKVFRFPHEIRAAGYEPVEGVALHPVHSWADHARFMNELLLEE